MINLMLASIKDNHISTLSWHLSFARQMHEPDSKHVHIFDTFSISDIKSPVPEGYEHMSALADTANHTSLSSVLQVASTR